jgi:hypothetical protein
MKTIDMIGQRFEKALVVERAPNKSEKDTNARWHCVCDCGTKFISYGQDLRRGKVKSCGCLTRGTIGARSRNFNQTHGMTESRIYRIWTGMLNRCRNPNNGNFHRYGGRGIKVCDEWLLFEGFVNDMGVPADDMSLDRIDGDGDYCKANCRWSTRHEQASNRRSSVKLTHNGITLTATEWARVLGISPTTMFGRINAGYPPEKLFSRNLKRIGGLP